MARGGISVCMATYNGERFLRPQVDSILEQLGANDEVVVVDDCSADGTRALLESYGDPRIKLFTNASNRREVYSFGRAISLAVGDVIFLSDQDDIWLPGRVALMSRSLEESGKLLVTTNFSWVDTAGHPIEEAFDGVHSETSDAWTANIVEIFKGRTNYFGCAMAFRRELVPTIIPIPRNVESHDLWIALAANFRRSNLHLDEQTFLKRKHDSNATSTVSTRPLWKKLRARAIFLANLAELHRRRGRRR